MGTLASSKLTDSLFGVYPNGVKAFLRCWVFLCLRKDATKNCPKDVSVVKFPSRQQEHQNGWIWSWQLDGRNVGPFELCKYKLMCLSAIMLSAIMLSVIMICWMLLYWIVSLCWVSLYWVSLCWVSLCYAECHYDMLNVVILSVVMPSVIMICWMSLYWIVSLCWIVTIVTVSRKE